MDFNRKFIEEIIEAAEEHVDVMKYSTERARVRRVLPSLKEAPLEPEVVPTILDKVYKMMMDVQASTDVKFMNLPDEGKFFEAITGLSWEQTKDDQKFCEKYVAENKVDPDSKRRYNTAKNSSGILRRWYMMHQLREEWEGGESE